MSALSHSQQKLSLTFLNCKTITENSTITLYRGVGLTSPTPYFPNGHWYESNFSIAKTYATNGSYPGSPLKCLFVDTVISNNNLKLISLNQSIFKLSKDIYPDLFYSNAALLHKTLTQDIQVIFKEKPNLISHDGIYMEKTGEYFILDPMRSLKLINTQIV
jgi:hypothetical protein